MEILLRLSVEGEQYNLNREVIIAMEIFLKDFLT